MRGVPPGTYVSRVVASHAGRGTAWATFDAHRDGDFRPYVFRTADFGRTWEPHVRGLPSMGSVNVLVEHPDRPTLLFLGTEHALFVSTDAGATWVRFAGNLPTTLYDDLVVHPRDHDLIVGTHGRSLWILDDVTPLAEWSADVAAAALHLFSVRPPMIFQYWKNTSYRGQAAFSGENPPFGVVVTYWLKAGAPDARLVVTNGRGEEVRVLDVPAAGGLHRVTWDLRHRPPPFAEEDDEEGEESPTLPHPVTPRGPFVAPGDYTLTLEAAGRQARRSVTVRGDTLMSLSAGDWDARERFLLSVLRMQEAVWHGEQRAGEAADRGGAAADSARALQRRVAGLRRQIYGLAGEFNGNGVRQGSLYPPTDTHRQRREELEAALSRELDAVERVVRQ